jgi:hypothetical protein
MSPPTSSPVFPIVSTTSALPTDFVEYFAQKRGISREAAVDLIGEGIVNYERHEKASPSHRVGLARKPVAA